MDAEKKQEVVLIQPDTKVTGTELLGSGLPVPQYISRFIDNRVVSRKSEYPWTERKNP